MSESKTHHFAISNEITDSGKDEIWLLKPVNKKLLEERTPVLTGTQLESVSLDGVQMKVSITTQEVFLPQRQNLESWQALDPTST